MDNDIFLVQNRVRIWRTGRHTPPRVPRSTPLGIKKHRSFTNACSPYDSVLGSELALASRHVIHKSSPSSSNILGARLSQSPSLLIFGSGSRFWLQKAQKIFVCNSRSKKIF